jgi:hypothetical protein
MKMIGRLIMLGIGYVLGSRAGRERYEQIVRAAQQAAERLDGYSGESSRSGRGRLSDRVDSGTGRTSEPL